MRWALLKLLSISCSVSVMDCSNFSSSSVNVNCLGAVWRDILLYPAPSASEEWFSVASQKTRPRKDAPSTLAPTSTFPPLVETVTAHLPRWAGGDLTALLFPSSYSSREHLLVLLYAEQQTPPAQLALTTSCSAEWSSRSGSSPLRKLELAATIIQVHGERYPKVDRL